MVREYYDMDRFLARILHTDEGMVNQWQYEELGKVLRKSRVLLYSEGISSPDRENLPVSLISSIEEWINRALEQYGSDASIAVIPKGPYILAELDRT